MSKRSFAITTTAALCGGAMLLTGCGQAAQSSMNATARGDTAAQGENAAAQGESAAARGEVPASGCAGEDFKIMMRPQPDDPGSFLLELQNTSDKSCHVGGWANLVPVGSKAPRIDVPTEHVEAPAPPKDDIQLAPGATAFSGVRAELGDPPVVAAGFDATLSNTPGDVPTEVEKPEGSGARIPVTHLQIGTLQPTPEGVLF